MRMFISRVRKLDGDKRNSMTFLILIYLQILMRWPINKHVIGETYGKHGTEAKCITRWEGKTEVKNSALKILM